MNTTHFLQIKNSGSLHYPLMASVAMHLCVFSMIFFWSPEMATMVRKNPIIKINVALLETPQKMPAPAVPQSVPMPAQQSPSRQPWNVLPAFDSKRIPEIIATASSQRVSSEFISKPGPRIAPLKMARTTPATTRPISFSTWPAGNFKGFQRTAHQPVNPSPAKTFLSASHPSIKFDAVAGQINFHSKFLKPVSIQRSDFPAPATTQPVASARALSVARYRSPSVAPLKMVSITDFVPKPFPKYTLEGHDNELRMGYTRQIRHRIAQKKFYPALARRRGFEGQPVVAFILNRDGSLGHLELDKTSGHKVLDQAAIKAVKKGVPFPKIPEQLNLKIFKFKLPISFALE